MNATTYEIHNLEKEPLPIIFHEHLVPRNEFYSANWHENIELLYFTEGYGQALCNSVIYDVEAGDIIIVNSNAIHGIRSRQQCAYHCLIIDSSFLASNNILVKNIEFQALVRSQQTGVFFNAIVQELKSYNSFQATGVRANILMLMLYLARNHSSPVFPQKKGRVTSDESIKRGIAYINEHLSHKITLEDLADQVNLSKCYFAHEFKKATGMTVVAYINAARCHAANRLLLTRQYSVNEVAAKCGFENNSYFSKTFKRVMGYLPSESTKLS